MVRHQGALLKALLKSLASKLSGGALELVLPLGPGTWRRGRNKHSDPLSTPGVDPRRGSQLGTTPFSSLFHVCPMLKACEKHAKSMWKALNVFK